MGVVVFLMACLGLGQRKKMKCSVGKGKVDGGKSRKTFLDRNRNLSRPSSAKAVEHQPPAQNTIETCRHCGGSLKSRNPTGICDHLYYPEYCDECNEKCKNVYSKMTKMTESKEPVSPKEMLNIGDAIDDVRARIVANLPITDVEWLRPYFKKEWNWLIEHLELREKTRENWFRWRLGEHVKMVIEDDRKNGNRFTAYARGINVGKLKAYKTMLRELEV